MHGYKGMEKSRAFVTCARRWKVRPSTSPTCDIRIRSLLIEPLSLLCPQAEARAILDHFLENEWMEWHTGRWFASARLMNLGERGGVHSDIPDSDAFTVMYIDSGKWLGTIAGDSIGSLCSGKGRGRSYQSQATL